MLFISNPSVCILSTCVIRHWSMLIVLPSTLCGLPCLPVYKYSIDLFTFYDIWLQLKISFRKSCKVISIDCNIIMQGWNWPESQSKIRKLTHYLQSRPTAEIAILVCRSQGDSDPSWLESMILLKSKSLSWSWSFCIPCNHCSIISWIQERLKCRVPIALAAAQWVV